MPLNSIKVQYLSKRTEFLLSSSITANVSYPPFKPQLLSMMNANYINNNNQPKENRNHDEEGADSPQAAAQRQDV